MAPKRSAPAAEDEERGVNGSNSSTKHLRRHFEYPRPGPVSSDFEARASLQRALGLALNHIGFDAATPEAMEDFTHTVETYVQSFVEELKRISLASRREQPTPDDFASALRGFNLPVHSLKPHLRPPLRRDVLLPSSFYDPLPELADDPSSSSSLATSRVAALSFALLGDDLSGRADKDSKEYIPVSFPDFPSRHTYRCTAHEVQQPDHRAATTADAAAAAANSIREEAARSAKEAEDALRKLVRASKVRKQKEVRSVVGRDGYSRERYQVWEEVMKAMVEKQQQQQNDHNHQRQQQQQQQRHQQSSRGEDEKKQPAAAGTSTPSSGGGDPNADIAGREPSPPGLGIADQSMIVNAEMQFLRREVARSGKRAGGGGATFDGLSGKVAVGQGS